MRRTKIVCTLGPATDDVETIKELIRNGLDGARINFSHGTYESHTEIINKLKQAREDLNAPIPLILDTKGPEIRLKTFDAEKYYLERKTAATLTGKASRARMLIEDKSVTIPLTIICSLVAVFVIVMYIMIPFGALFKLWGRDYSLSWKWFEYLFKYSGFKAFKDSFILSIIAAPITALLSMVISYLVVYRKHGK